MTLDELAQRAGVWVETLQVYVQRGVLPSFGTDASAYDESHLGIVRFIGRMQSEHQLPLSVISEVLADRCGYDVAKAEEVLVPMTSPDPGRAGPGPTNREGLLRRTGAPAALLDRLVAAHLIPAEGPYGGHHVWILEASVALRGTGLGDDEIEAVGRLGIEVAEAEVDALVSEVCAGRPPRQALAGTEERRAAVGRLLSVARQSSSAKMMAGLAEAQAHSEQLALESVHVPSRLFLGRHGLEEAVAQQALAAKPALAGGDGNPDAVREHARLLLGLGRFTDALRVLEAAVQLPSLREDGTCWCYLGLARAICGEPESAASAAEQAVEYAPSSPRVHAFRAAVMALGAAGAADVLLATARIHDCLRSVACSRELVAHAQDPLEELEALVTRGRLCTVMPEPFGVREEGLRDLDAVLERTKGPVRDEELGFVVRGGRDLVRINALFYAGMAKARSGRLDEARPLLLEVVALDPISGYATRAFKTLHDGVG